MFGLPGWPVHSQGAIDLKRQLLALVLLQGMDVFTTMQGLGAGAVEQNPVGVIVLSGGWVGLALAKLLGTGAIAGIAWVMWQGSELNRVQALVGLQFACSLMLAVVSWNFWIGFLHSAG